MPVCLQWCFIFQNKSITHPYISKSVLRTFNFHPQNARHSVKLAIALFVDTQTEKNSWVVAGKALK